jgi:hypothetical protein
MTVFWIVAPCSIVVCANVPDEHADYIFRAEMGNIRKWMADAWLGEGSGQGSLSVRAME